MSELLSDAIARGEEWASDDHYQGILDASGAVQVVTPLQFANDIKDRVGWIGHWMMVAEEGSLAARWSKHNIVIIAYNHLSNDGAPEIYKFPVLGPEECDNPAAVWSLLCLLPLTPPSSAPSLFRIPPSIRSSPLSCSNSKATTLAVTTRWCAR
jgi:hypothetical protein